MPEEVIRVYDLKKYYGDFPAVKGISFSVKKGEVFGFLGPNGAGKTTTIRMLTGILEPSEGRIEVFGMDVTKDKLKIRERVGIVPEMANPYIDLSAMQNLFLMGRLYGMKKKEIKERSLSLLETFKLYNKKDQKVRTFSKGMKQRLSLAMALLPDPELLFLDEPTSGLDVMSARLIKDIIISEQQRGKTIFLNTHNMQDANELCNRVAIINHGKIVAIDTPEKIKELGAKYNVVEVSFSPFKVNEDFFSGKVKVSGDKLNIHTEDVHRTIEEIVEFARREKIKIVTLNVKKPSLEDIFMEIVKKNA